MRRVLLPLAAVAALLAAPACGQDAGPSSLDYGPHYDAYAQGTRDCELRVRGDRRLRGDVARREGLPAGSSDAQIAAAYARRARRGAAREAAAEGCENALSAGPRGSAPPNSP